MHTRNILLVVLLTLLVFSNSLFNQFIGDDHVIIVENSFYTSWKNISSLFKEEYLTSSTMQPNYIIKNYHSGSVAYRPVLSLTFFFDYWIWKLNPFGYHVTNLLLHLINAVLVYFLFVRMFKNNNWALFASLLFSLHPTKVEAVCSIGYRADMVVTLFLLAAFLSYLKFIDKRNSSRIFYGISLASYFLALFTKEAAIVLPILLILYESYFCGLRLNRLNKDTVARYGPFVLVSVFYVYIYAFVFPNTSFIGIKYLGGSLASHIATIFWIFTKYVFDLICMFTVSLVPPLYAPPVSSGMMAKMAAGVILFFGFLLAAVKLRSHQKELSFFLLWFVIAFLPVSNIIPLANPMAHRFLYFPSIGFLAATAILIQRLCLFVDKNSSTLHLGMILKSAILGLCIVTTVPLNMLWRHDFSVATSLIENYPNDIKSHNILGYQYLKAGALKQAAVEFRKCIELESKDPMIFFLMGMCVFDQPSEAEMYFRKAIEIWPHADAPYTAIGRIYFLQKDFEKAIPYFEAAVNIRPTYTSCAFLLQSYFQVGRLEDMQVVLQKAKAASLSKEILAALEVFLNTPEKFKEPVDVWM